MAAEDNSWRTQAFRQSVVKKIDEEIQRSGISTPRNSVDMENHVFQRVKTKEEYLGLVARLILHIREISKKMQCPTGQAPGSASGGMQDPLYAVQTLASQGSRNAKLMGPPIAAPNPPQSLNWPNAMLQQPMSNQCQLQRQSLQPQLPGPNQLQGQMGAQMQGQLPSQMQGQLQNLRL